MAFSCLHENTEVKSFTYSQAEWSKLADRFAGMRMTMPCCDQPARMFTDSYGGQYFIHDEPIDGIASPCMESSSLSPGKLYAKFVISKTLHDLGWHVDAEPIVVNAAKNELQTGIYARKGDNKNVVEVLSAQEPLAVIKEKSNAHKLAGFKIVWFNLRDRRHRDSHYGIHADKNLLLFELILSKGEIFQVSDVYLPAETEDEPNFFTEVAKPVEVTLTIKDFFEQLMARNISWLARDDGNHYLTVGVGKKACYKCGGLVGKFFEDEEFYQMKCCNWESVSDRVVSAKPHKGHLNNEPGRWILNIDPNTDLASRISSELISRTNNDRQE